MIAAIIPLAFYIIACQEQVSETSTIGDEIAVEAQQKFDELTKAHPDKKFLLMETDEKMNPKQEDMKQKLASLDQRQITHINLITTTATADHPRKTYAIVEYDAVIVDEGLRKRRDQNVFTEVDEMALPTGGMDQFYAYVARNLRYPTEARMKGIEGKVFVEFVVNTDGSIEVTGISGIGAGCDLEAMRVVQTSPAWTPGKNDGIAVRQKMVLPITFSMRQSNVSNEVRNPEKSMQELVVAGKKPSN
jgi:TonB family protein